MSKEEILYNQLGGFSRSMLSDEDIYQAMGIYAKDISVKFFDYIDRYRKEEGRSFRKECERVGGMFSYMGKSVDKIYDDFINKVPIKSEMVPDGFPNMYYMVDENYNISEQRK